MFKNVFSALLADKKISKAKFAEEIGVTRQTVYSWLDGNFAPDKKTEEKIAAYFNVSIDYLRGVAASATGWTVIPIVGTVPAGNPVEAVECHEGSFSLPAHVAMHVDFGLRVKGESMTNAGILSGDIVFVKLQPTAENKQIVVARIDEETTIKRFFKTDHSIMLKPENNEFEPILIDKSKSKVFQIVGVVTGLWRPEIK